MGTNYISGTAEAKSDQILYADRLYQVPAYGGQITLQRGVIWVTWPVFLILPQSYLWKWWR